MARSFASRARPAFLRPKKVHAIAACIPSHRLRDWSPHAPKAECWEFCLLLIDALGMKFRELKLRKNPDCPACGKNPTITKLIDYQEFCGIRGEEAPAEVTASEMQVEELKKRLDRGDDLFVLDVREPHEYQICNIDGHLIPLGDLPNRVNELDTSREIVAHCRSGVRSAKAVNFLRQAGFKKVHNLAGGILAWADRVDPKMPKY